MKKGSWSEQNKDGMVVSGFVKMNNELTRQMIFECDMQTAMCYMIILSHRNTETGKCYPSISKIAKECGVSTRTVDRMIGELHSKGYLIIDSGRQGVANTYFFPKEDFYDNEGVCAKRTKKGNFEKKEYGKERRALRALKKAA